MYRFQTCDDVHIRADRLPPGWQAGVVAVVGHRRARHQQLGLGPRARLLGLEADAAAGGVEVEDLKEVKKNVARCSLNVRVKRHF